MKLSVNTWIYGEAPMKEVFQKLKAQGFGAVEMYGRDEEVDMSDAEVAEIKKAAADMGIEIAVCCADTGLLNPAYGRNLCSMDPAVRKKAIDHCYKGIDHTKRLGSRVCILCVGKLEEGQTEQQAFDLAVESYKELIKYAREKDVVIVIENFPDRWIGKCENLLKLCQAIGDPEYCKGMIDTGHELMLGNSLANAARTLGKDYMGHLHLNNNNGEVDNHDAMDSGKLTADDFAELAKALKEIDYKGWYSCELLGVSLNRDPDKVLADSKKFFDQTMAGIIG